MSEPSRRQGNPRRVAAGKANRARRGPLTEGGRQRLREAALANQPWRYATGPRSSAGKAQAARNGKLRQAGPSSVREVRAELRAAKALIRAISASTIRCLRALQQGEKIAFHRGEPDESCR
jgi:hypothetical protein